MSGPRGYIFCDSDRADELDAILAQADTAPVRFKDYVQADLDSVTLARVTAAGFETYLRPQAAQPLKQAAQSPVTFIAASADAVRFRAACSDALLARVASLPQVRMLTPVRATSFAVDRIRRLVGVTAAGGAVPLMGEGQIIAILDSGIIDHPDFKDRIKAKVGFDG